MYAICWKPAGENRYEAEYDGRYARVTKTQDGWRWVLTYCGDVGAVSGTAQTLRGAQSAVARIG